MEMTRIARPGSGGHLQMFKQFGYAVTGLEPDAKARAIASRVAPVLAGTAEQLPDEFQGRRFGVVLLSHVLEHCISPHVALDNARSLLDEGGTLVIEVPNCAAYAFLRQGGMWPWSDVPRHLHFFTEVSLGKMLERSRLKLDKVLFTGFTRHFTPDWLAMQETVWREIGSGPLPNLELEAWRELARTAFASPAAKYDSLRVHAKVAE